jgi:membrane fusion protein (multidrug efflux system)
METITKEDGSVHDSMGSAHKPFGKPGGNNHKNRLILIGASIAGVLAVVGLWYYIYSLSHQDTDDAFIDGHIFMISPSVSGPVIKIAVDDNQYVKQGDLLVQIDPREYEARLSQSNAEVSAASASAHQAELDLARYLKLYRQNQISQQTYDHAASAVAVAQANLKLSIQKEAAAALNLSYTKITAPADGYVTKKSVELQDYEQMGQTLMAVVSPNVWVTANFKETELRGMKPGDRVDIYVDLYPGKVFKGHVDSIQDGSGARFSLFPPENATGNYVKVVQRIPVKIVFDGPVSSRPFLAPGMSVSPVVKLKNKG